MSKRMHVEELPEHGLTEAQTRAEVEHDGEIRGRRASGQILPEEILDAPQIQPQLELLRDLERQPRDLGMPAVLQQGRYVALDHSLQSPTQGIKLEAALQASGFRLIATHGLEHLAGSELTIHKALGDAADLGVERGFRGGAQRRRERQVLVTD